MAEGLTLVNRGFGPSRQCVFTDRNSVEVWHCTVDVIISDQWLGIFGTW